ncbi:hypothetical protein HK096_011241 [Nowakowskiella sp. JEL0078]|nr:hypothetical protein HK096_011241 [Nowakowskiella sp. JEL0078]
MKVNTIIVLAAALALVKASPFPQDDSVTTTPDVLGDLSTPADVLDDSTTPGDVLGDSIVPTDVVEVTTTAEVLGEEETTATGDVLGEEEIGTADVLGDEETDCEDEEETTTVAVSDESAVVTDEPGYGDENVSLLGADSSSSSSVLSTPAIVGIAVGGVALIAVAGVAVWKIRSKKQAA